MTWQCLFWLKRQHPLETNAAFLAGSLRKPWRRARTGSENCWVVHTKGMEKNQRLVSLCTMLAGPAHTKGLGAQARADAGFPSPCSNVHAPVLTASRRSCPGMHGQIQRNGILAACATVGFPGRLNTMHSSKHTTAPGGSSAALQCPQVQAYSTSLHPPQLCRSSLKRKFCGLASADGLNCTTML